MKFRRLQSTFRASAVSICIVLVTMFSCKDELIESPVNSKNITGTESALSGPTVVATDPLLDSAETPTILGARLPNPYLLDNMRQAYLKVKGTSAGVTVNNLYVRFQPTSVSQLVTLQETLDLDLTDVPMDYKIVQHGEYYQDPSIPDEQITYQYAVVPPDFSFPAEIPYTILASLHIPSDTYVEAAAEQLAGLNSDGDDLASSGGNNSSAARVTPMVAQCPTGYHWNYTVGGCVVDACVDGYYWDSSLGKCMPIPTSTPTTPPGLPPAGTITVWDTQLNKYSGVRNVRVVAKRWFKVERMTTDALGRFTATKRFRNKVKVVVKFKNGDSVIRGIRGLRLWKMLLPLQRVFGPISGSEINTYQHKFNYYTGIKTLGNQLWNAATINNSVQEYKGYATQLQIGSLPSKIKIFISGNTSNEGSSSTPMFAKRGAYDTNIPFYQTYGINYSSIVMSALSGVLAGELDMIIDYYKAKSDKDPSNDMTSDKISETIYHELTHAAHYNKLGNTWYTEFVNAEITEIVNYHDGKTKPYGPGTNSVSPIIALGEGWAYHMGHYIADIKYGVYASCQDEEETNYCPYSAQAVHPHIDVLENYDPTSSYVFHWIPKGLMLDLMDDTPLEKYNTAFPDQVSGFTNKQFYNALTSDVKSIDDFRDKLLLQNSNNQQSQVLNLVNFYGY